MLHAVQKASCRVKVNNPIKMEYSTLLLGLTGAVAGMIGGWTGYLTERKLHDAAIGPPVLTCPLGYAFGGIAGGGIGGAALGLITVLISILVKDPIPVPTGDFYVFSIALYYLATMTALFGAMEGGFIGILGGFIIGILISRFQKRISLRQILFIGGLIGALFGSAVSPAPGRKAIKSEHLKATLIADNRSYVNLTVKYYHCPFVRENFNGNVRLL